MQVQVLFNTDSQVTINDFIEGEIYEAPTKDLYLFLFDVEDKMYMWNLQTFRIHPIEEFLEVQGFVHKGTINSINLKR